jgi:hypothetical protein
MKYLKLISFFIFLISYQPINASDLLEPDNAAVIPELEPLKIDLEAIKQNSKVQKSTTNLEKTKKVSASFKRKASDKELIKKKTRTKKKKNSKSRLSSDSAKQTVKHIKTEKKSTPVTDKKKIKSAKIKQKADQKLIVKPEDNNKNKLLADNNIQTETGLTKPDKNSANNPEKISNTPVSDIIIINPSEKDATTNRLYKINYTEIYKWAKPQGLKVKEDAPPVIDGLAFYTPDFFAEFKVEGYDRNREYKLYIDFVRFENGTLNINSLLKIWGRDYSGKMFFIAEIKKEILEENKIFDAIIPYELSSPGRFDIIVREYSDTPGKWGIWDIIITDKKIDRIDLIRPDASEKMKEIDPKIFK